MKKISFFLIIISISTTFTKGFSQKRSIETWLTLPDQTLLFEKQKKLIEFEKSIEKNTLPTIIIDEKKSFQRIDGFGFTLTGGSATLLNSMNKKSRKEILNELFSVKENAIGLSFLRISIGASDLSEGIFSYDDLAIGKTDSKLKHFDMGMEQKDLIPILKDILAINPSLKLLATPWSPPAWMKSNESSKGGSLKEKFYDTYADYLVHYLQIMEKEGLAIDAITLQNEPLHPGNNPSMLMYPYEQANFIKQSLGPAFKKVAIKTKIILYDHNADRPDYPLQILNDNEAAQYVDGSAFHLYGGSVEAIGDVHDAFPDKNVYFTEQWTGAKGTFEGDLNWHIRTLIIGATRNWCKTVLEWNLANDENFGPHTVGGCTECLGALTITQNDVKRNVSYYIIAHASKFVRPDSERIFSNQLSTISNVAFKTPDGKIVLIAQNETNDEQEFVISFLEKSVTIKLPPKAVATLVW